VPITMACYTAILYWYPKIST